MPNSLFAKAYLPKSPMDFVVLLPRLYEGTNIQIFSLITIKIIELGQGNFFFLRNWSREYNCVECTRDGFDGVKANACLTWS